MFTFSPLPHKEAVSRIAELPLVSREVMDGLLPELRAYAFTITGLDVGDQMAKARDLIAAVPAGSKTWDKAKREIAAELADDLGGKASQRRAELLLRTHVFRGYAASRYRRLMAMIDAYPYWQYKTHGDGNVRPSHAALNGKIFPAGHDIWQRIFPPWDWGCRCLVVPLTQRSAEGIMNAGKIGEQAAKDANLLPTQIAAPEIFTAKEASLIDKNQRLPNGIPLNRTPTWSDSPWSIPGTVQHDWQLIKARYADQPEALKAFEQWAKKTKVNPKLTVSRWIGLAPKRIKKAKVIIQGNAFPADALGLRVVKKLGGSTGAELVEDANGVRFVRKRGASADHLREEVQADELYRNLGFAVPEARLYETANGPVKLSRFVEGRSLADVLASGTPAEKEAVMAKIREGFVADAYLGNWDVAGMGMDNILVDKDGTPWRIDNGGSLRFRAMGKRKTADQWGDAVSELESMRDAAQNPSAAKIFAGLSEDDMQRQWHAMAPKLEAALATAPAEIRETLTLRAAWLESRLNPGVFSTAFAQEVNKAGVLGVTHLGDRDLIEDTTILVWQEKDTAGNLVTRLKLRLTEKGSATMVDALGESLSHLKPLSAAGKRAVPGDVFWQPLESTLKHINHHAKDGAYNPAKTAMLDTLEKQLAAFPASSDEAKAMVVQYKAIITEARAAMVAKKTTAFHHQYEPPAPAGREKQRGRLDVKASSLAWKKKAKDRGEAQQQAEQIFQQQAYEIERDNAAMHFIPWLESNGARSSAPYAFRGYVEMTVPGKADTATLQKAADLLRDAGVDIARVRPAFQETLYLAKGLSVMERKLTPKKRAAWRQIADAADDDETKLSSLKAWVKKNLPGVDLNGPHYQPQGSAAAGRGWQTWDRWDLPRAQIEKEMADYTLTHHVSGGLPDVVDSILSGGGQFTPTTERLRTGVPISQGMSPMSDMNSGGANYLFTRITPRHNVRGSTLCFKTGNLARMDAFSFDEDRYGDVRPPGETTRSDYRKKRAVTVDEFKAYSNKSSNETIFKWGLHLLEQLDFIHCSSDADRKAVRSIFAKHKITRLPDGRDIQSIIQ